MRACDASLLRERRHAAIRAVSQIAGDARREARVRRMRHARSSRRRRPRARRALRASSMVVISPLTMSGIPIASLTGRTRSPVSAALEELGARAPMHGDELDTGSFSAPRQLGRITRAVIPAEPHLERDRNRNGTHYGFDELQGVVEVAHERRARAPCR